MELVLLIIHLLVCVCLIGLVLLQRSEGGALGMGGGGGGSLMSGRGAADALARMTQVAGGFFLVTSLGLTVLSGAAASSNGGGSVFDSVLPRQESTPTPAPTPAQEEPARPDPTESSIPADTQLASASASTPPEVAPSSTESVTRAQPLPAAAAPAQRPLQQPERATVQPAAANAGQVPARTQPPAQRSTAATTQPSQEAAERPLVIPNTSGGISGVNLTDDAALQPESIQVGNGVEAVRRERAGPDQ